MSGADEWANFGELSFCFRRTGSGPPVLTISGTGADLRWLDLADFAWARRFEVLSYDQRGLGRSTIRDVPVTMADFADDAARLAAHVGWSSCRVVGVSFGGMVAQELALRHPALVERLVLCCTSPGGAGGSSYPLQELEKLDPETRGRRMAELIDLRHDQSWQANHPEAFGGFVAQMSARASATGGEPDREIGARRQLEARAGHDTWDRLPSLSAPTLVCAGRYDGIAPLANSEALVSRIPGARLEVFDGGHVFLFEEPRAWSVIEAFLSQSPAFPHRK